jgi:hypothetical protein
MKTATFYRSLLFAILFASAQFANAQAFTFTNANNLLGAATHSGCCLVVVDVNSDGLDDIVKLDQSSMVTIELQNKDGSFSHYPNLGNISGTTNMWGMAMADVDHNGWKDIAAGSGQCHLVYLSWNGSTIVANNTSLPQSYFVQNITFGDFNNDGWSDLFVCDDDNYGRVYMNDGIGTLRPIGQSQTTLTIGTGTQNLTVQTGLAFTAGQSVKVGYNGSNYMTGTVTSYNSGTGDLDVNITSVVGSGSFDGWSVDEDIVMDININPGLTTGGGDPYDSGNYGSVWLDFDNDNDLDLYIAHCRQPASSSTDVRRRDRLFVNNGDGTYTEGAQARGIEVSNFKQTWTTSFADIDNDGDFDLIMTNHGENGQILRNDGTGNFTDITGSTNFLTTGMDPIESLTEDFDNDGWIDILVTGGGGGLSYYLYRNNGNSTFTQTQVLPATSNGMLSAGFGDLNHDGKIDLFCSYGDVYVTPSTTDDVMYLNTTQNTNHFITFDLKGTVSNIGAIGARVTIYGPWGKQIREVRAGESYGTGNSFQLHFGLGATTVVDSARIDWPSHIVTNLTNLAADQFVTVVENTCTITGNIIPGPYALCAGDTLTLNAANGFSSYLWSNGGNTQSIDVTSTGNYNVTVTDGNGCFNVSPTISVVQNPDETPTVTALGSLEFCDGGSVTLSSSSASSYLWSSGQNTQSINVTTAGSYWVTIQGSCDVFTSDTIIVSVLANPTAVSSDQSWNGPHSFTLTATGNTLSWWDAATGGTQLGTGTSYITPVLNSTTTYWVENVTAYPGTPVSVGRTYGSGTYNNTINGGLDFNVLAPCVIESVKVYTDNAHYGVRQIQIKDNAGNIIDSLSVNVNADSMVVPLNMTLPVGTGYRITTNALIDSLNFGAASPFFQRHSNGSSYPYTAAGLITISNGWTGSSTSTAAYYYFYNWKVSELGTTCTSSRIPVQAIILPVGINTFTVENNFKIYPNPTAGNLIISFNMTGSSDSKVDFIDGTGRTVSSEMIANTGNVYEKSFDLSNLAKGMYTIHVSCGEKTSYQRLVIQ